MVDRDRVKASLGVDDCERVVWVVTAYAFDHSLSVLLVACHVDEREDL